MKLTTGYEFQGYFITDYYDVIFDEMLVGLGFGRSLLSSLDNLASSLTGGEATVMVEKLNAAKFRLRERVIQKASQLGANALIGIDFESSKLGDIIMVSMTATAVHIEKIVSDLPYTERNQREDIEKERQQKAQQERAVWEATREDIKRTSDITPEAILSLVSQLDDAREMNEVIHDFSSNNPGYFSPDFLEGLSSSVELGRMYGKRVGAESFVANLKKYLQGNPVF